MFSKVKTGVDCQKQPPLNYTVEVVEKMINYGLSALFYRRQTCKISFTVQCMLSFTCGAQTHIQQSFWKAAVLLCKIFTIKEKSGRFTCALIQNKIYH